MRFVHQFAVASITLACTGAALAQKGETVKMVRIDPLTGLLGPVGINQQKTYQFFAEKFNASNPAGVKFEISFIDNKLSPTESLNSLKTAIDQGARYIIQGDGSSVALALSDAVSKHNERNPGKEVVYINDSAVDPDLTNSKCSYWHFRFDADTSMKMEALSSFMVDQKDVKKVYLLNQNYSHGQQVAKYAKETIGRKRPDIQFVGEDLHPLAQVRDFAPYIAKIKASGADTVLPATGARTCPCWSKPPMKAAIPASSSPTICSSLALPPPWVQALPVASTRSAQATTTWAARWPNGWKSSVPSTTMT
jgi:branched-chain amino acid transport system substrate-binding protein